MIPEEHISKEYCAARSGGIERVQKMAERRLDGHGHKLDDLTAAVERVTLLLERQEQRLDHLENRNFRAFFESATGKAILRYIAVGLLILLSAALGVNAVQILKEVL